MSRIAGTPGAAASGTCTEGTERDSSCATRDGCGARPAPRAVSVSWGGLPERSPRGVSLILGREPARSSLRVELLELAQLAPPLVHRRIVVMRLFGEVAS